MTTATDPYNFRWLPVWVFGGYAIAVALIVLVSAVLWLQVSAGALNGRYLLGALTCGCFGAALRRGERDRR